MTWPCLVQICSCLSRCYSASFLHENTTVWEVEGCINSKHFWNVCLQAIPQYIVSWKSEGEWGNSCKHIFQRALVRSWFCLRNNKGAWPQRIDPDWLSFLLRFIWKVFPFKSYSFFSFLSFINVEKSIKDYFNVTQMGNCLQARDYKIEATLVNRVTWLSPSRDSCGNTLSNQCLFITACAAERSFSSVKRIGRLHYVIR